MLVGHHLRVDPADATAIQQVGAGIPRESGDTAREPDNGRGHQQDARGRVVAVATAIST